MASRAFTVSVSIVQNRSTTKQPCALRLSNGIRSLALGLYFARFAWLVRDSVPSSSVPSRRAHDWRFVIIALGRGREGTMVPATFEHNGVSYHWSDKPIAVVCIDGGDPAISKAASVTGLFRTSPASCGTGSVRSRTARSRASPARTTCRS